MERATVGIVGLGAVSAAGGDIAATLESFKRGERRGGRTRGFATTIACPTFEVAGDLGGENKHPCRTIQLAMRAVGEAWGAAGLSESGGRTRVGVCVGTTVASQLNHLAFYESYRKTGNPPVEPVWEFLRGNLAEAIAGGVGVGSKYARGPRMTVVNACSSGTDAIGIAASWIRAGLCDVAIAGGADELGLVPLAGFWSLGVMSSELCRPFDGQRSGLNLGEGAGMVVLESGEHAAARGRKIEFTVAGFGAGCDAHHLTAPHPEGRGLRAAIEGALAQAGIGAGQVAFINAHGTATLDNDRVEGKVIQNVFGQGAAFLSTKGYTGHTLGAAGGLEAVFTVLGLREGWIPASAGFAQAAEEIGMAPVREVTRVAGDYALSTSLAFGGNNAALVVRRVI